MTDKKNKNLISNFISYFYGNFAVIILGFISTPIITRCIQTEEFGKGTLFYTAVTIINIFAVMGLDQSYIRYYYKQGVNTRVLMRQCIVPPLIISMIFACSYWIGAETFNGILFGKDDLDVRWLIIIYFFSAIIERFMMLNIRMRQKGNLYSLFCILNKVLYVAIILIAFYFIGDDYRVVVYAYTLSLGIVALLMILWYLWVTNKEAENIQKTHQIHFPELLHYGIPFILMLLVNWAMTSTDKVMIKYFGDYSEVGIYSAALSIVSILINVKIAFATFWVPVALEKYEKEDDKTCHAFFRNIFSKVQLLCFFAVIMLILFRKIIILFLGSSYREAIIVLPCLAIMPAFDIMFEITSQGLNFKQQVRYYNISSVIVLFGNIIGNLILIPRYNILGAAVATGFSYIIYFVSGTLFSQKCYKVPYNFKSTYVYIPLLFIYAIISSFTQNSIINISGGLFCILVMFILDFRHIRDMWLGLINISRSMLHKTDSTKEQK